MEHLLSAALSNAAVVSLLAAVVLVIDRTARRPALSHRLWLLLLLKLVTPPLVLVPWPSLNSPRPSTAPASASIVEPLASPARARRPAAGEATPAPAPPIAPATVEPAPPDRPMRKWAWTAAARVPPRWTVAVATLWLAVSAAWLAWTLWRLRRAQRVLCRAEPAAEPIQGQARALAARMGLRRCPAVWLMPGRCSPLVWGLSRAPRVLIPQELWPNLSAEQQAALLVHELAHVRRRDHWVRLLELVVISLYWWHPVAWWARRALREAEEQCCDAWVAWALPGSERAYAAALLDTVDFLADSPPLPLAASGLWDVSRLKERLAMIVRGRAAKSLSWRGTLSVLGVAGAMLPLTPPRAAVPLYTITDLGTLGGPTSRAARINNAGQVVGTSITPKGQHHAFRTHPNRPIDPATDDLGTLGGSFGDVRWLSIRSSAANSFGKAINNAGRAVGQAYVGRKIYLVDRFSPPRPFELLHGFGAGPAGMVDFGYAGARRLLERVEARKALRGLPTIPVAIHRVELAAINDSDQVAGTISRIPHDKVRLMGHGSPENRGFRARMKGPLDPDLEDLGDLGCSRVSDVIVTQATDINKHGQVVGFSYTADLERHAFRTAPNRPINPATDDLGTLGHPFSTASAVDDAGRAVGWSVVDKPGQGLHAFRTGPNRPIDPATDDLGTLGGPNSFAQGINNAGLVVGSSHIAPPRSLGMRSYPIHPYWDDVQPPNPAPYLEGQNVRTLELDLALHAFLHDGIRMIDLNDLIPPGTGWFLEVATDINDRGQIVGNGLTPEGNHHGFLLNPIPELDRLAFLAIGTAVSGLGFGLTRFLSGV